VGDNGGAIDLIVSPDGLRTERVQCKYTAARKKRYSARYVANLDTVSFTYMRSAADCVLTTS